MDYTISIIILFYNQYHVTEQCINCILRKTDLPFELILVDNGSTDETKEKLSRLDTSGYKNLKDLQIIHIPENVGIPKGVNEGIKKAKGDFICYTNNDIIVSRNWLLPLIEEMKSNPNLGIVSPVENYIVTARPYYFPEEYEYLMSRPPLQRRSLDSLDQYYNGFEHFAASFTKKYWLKRYFEASLSMFVTRKELFEEIGLFEEGFGVAFWEDVDFIQRTLLSKNFSEVMVYPGSYVHHYGNTTSYLHGRPQLLSSQQKFLEKWGEVGESIHYRLRTGLLNAKEVKKLRSELLPLLPFLK